MALYREKAQAVLVKVETTSGVDAVPTGANVVRTKGIPEIVVDYLESGDRGDVQTGILSAADDAAPAGRYGKIDLVMEVKGAGAAYSGSVLPECDALLRASGFSHAVTTTPGSEGVFYTTLDAGMETVTVYVYGGGKLFKLVGCVAQPRFQFNTNQVATVTFTVTGVLTADPTEVAVPALTFAVVSPPPFNSALNSIAGWLSSDATDPLMLLSASIDMGTAISDLPSAGANDGIVGYLVTDRNASQELQFFAPPLAKMDFFAASKQDGGAGIRIAQFVLGQVQYNKALFRSRWRPRAPRGSNRNGVKAYTVSGPLRASSAVNALTSGREIEITFN